MEKFNGWYYLIHDWKYPISEKRLRRIDPGSGLKLSDSIEIIALEKF